MREKSAQPTRYSLPSSFRGAFRLPTIRPFCLKISKEADGADRADGGDGAHGTVQLSQYSICFWQT